MTWAALENTNNKDAFRAAWEPGDPREKNLSRSQ
jgi:hypothetical protein